MRDDAAERGSELVRLERATARAQGSALLRDVSLTARAGEITTVVGPNGGGKTTLLRMAIGDLIPSAGRVWRKPGLRIGYAPQRLHLDPTLPLTVARFMSLAGGSSEASRAEALERVEATGLQAKQMTSLSGGERQRVLLARALARDPELLILDEPTQGLDQSGSARFYALIEAVRRERNVSVLMVSHELHVVMAASDQVICLNGHVCCQGAPEDVSAHPEYRRLFAATGDGALAIYRHQHDHDHEHTH